MLDLKETFKRKSKKAAKKITAHIYHQQQNKIAYDLLRSIEDERGKIPSSYLKLCKEYAIDTFGSDKYAPWLYVYSAIAGQFKEGWIPSNFYTGTVIPIIQGEYGQLNERDWLTNSLLDVKNPLDLCYFINGQFWSMDLEILETGDLPDILFQKNETVVYKTEKSLRGYGVYFFNRESFKPSKIKRQGNGVFQRFIEQHDFFSAFTDRSVATLRLNTVCDGNGNISLRGAILRFGRENDTHIKNDSAINIPLDLDEGEMTEFGFYPNYTTTNCHPDSRVHFHKKIVPYFKECVSEVLRMHSRIPFVGCIGWDVTVDQNNIFRLIEWNGYHNSIKLSEATQGPSFKDLGWEKLR